MRYWRTQLRSAENSINTASPVPITISVLWVRCGTTLSMMAWVNSGVPSASSWMMREASNTTRHNQNEEDQKKQKKPKHKQKKKKRGEQHITPHALVLQQLRDEPVETKLYLTGPCAIGILDSMRLQCQLKRGAGKTYRVLGLS